MKQSNCIVLYNDGNDNDNKPLKQRKLHKRYANIVCWNMNAATQAIDISNVDSIKSLRRKYELLAGDQTLNSSLFFHSYIL